MRRHDGSFAPPGPYTVQLKTTINDIQYIHQSELFFLEEPVI